MEDEADMRERTINAWVKDTKRKITGVAKEHSGFKRIETDRKRLRGCWDSETKEAIHVRKETKQKQRRTKKNMETDDNHRKRKWKER